MSIVVGTDTWITVADADTFFDQRFGIGTNWSGLSNADKEAALVTAYKQLNGCGLFSFPTLVADITQLMRDGQCEQALFIILHITDADKRKGLQAQGVKSAGIVKETYDEASMKDISISSIARGYLKSYLSAGENIQVINLTRDEEEDAI